MSKGGPLTYKTFLEFQEGRSFFIFHFFFINKIPACGMGQPSAAHMRSQM